jgi:transcriptional regulator with XRE-family HTH domain
MGLGGGSDAFSYTTEFCVWGRKRFGKDIKAAREAQCLSQGDVARIVLGDARNRLIQRWEEDDAWPRPDHVQALCSVLGWDETQFAGAPAKRWHSTWFNWKRGRHSAKPEAFLDLVEQTSPGPYLELFARRQRLGWDTWGDQALPHVDLEALKAREGQS